MKTLPNDIVLRPRFELELKLPKGNVLQFFEKSKKKDFLVKCIDEHVFIKFKKEHSHFWSPQLHLEITEINENISEVFGRFGPNPALWTFFMFLHFGIATLFIVCCIWGYSNWSLGKSYGLQLGILIFMIVVWFSLYAFGRVGKAKGKPQMKELYSFMKETLGL
ncbi:hypothetical protein GGR42_003381 [Saonia flava]|uniref:GTP-binding protein n=1 Tax=Saonia flava TaxID=523696 RepID=A0A846R3B8_9FLAO|nr:GTP-binding protein [Saonia flava]NJB72883.1 hypothetical protein [Saonia flava]